MYHADRRAMVLVRECATGAISPRIMQSRKMAIEMHESIDINMIDKNGGKG